MWRWEKTSRSCQTRFSIYVYTPDRNPQHYPDFEPVRESGCCFPRAFQETHFYSTFYGKFLGVTEFREHSPYGNEGLTLLVGGFGGRGKTHSVSAESGTHAHTHSCAHKLQLKNGIFLGIGSLFYVVEYIVGEEWGRVMAVKIIKIQKVAISNVSNVSNHNSTPKVCCSN